MRFAVGLLCSIWPRFPTQTTGRSAVSMGIGCWQRNVAAKLFGLTGFYDEACRRRRASCAAKGIISNYVINMKNIWTFPAIRVGMFWLRTSSSPLSCGLGPMKSAVNGICRGFYGILCDVRGTEKGNPCCIIKALSLRSLVISCPACPALSCCRHSFKRQARPWILKICQAGECDHWMGTRFHFHKILIEF